MSTVIIVGGSGGGHRAMAYVHTHYKSMKADQQARVAEIVRQFVDDINVECDQEFSTTEL